MSKKSRTALYVIGSLFAVLAVLALALPGYAAGAAIVAAMVLGVGILGAAGQQQPRAQLTAYDR